MKVSPVKDTRLDRAHEQTARHVGADVEFANVPRQQPRARVSHSAIFSDQVEIAQRGRRLHIGGDFRSALKRGPVFLIQVPLQ